MTEEERLQWAKDAERNPVIWESFEVLQKTYMSMASQCEAKDDLGRFRYLEAYKDIDIVKKHLQSILYNGHLTKQEKNQMKKKKFIPTF
jgi:quinol monooxygenase YgiN